MGAQYLGDFLLWLIILAIVIVIAVYILRWLYRRSTKETAFVRTGFLGEKVVVIAPRMAFSIATCAVLVRVCQCSTVRPVLRMRS